MHGRIGNAEAEKAGTMVVGGAPAFSESIVKEVPSQPTIEPKTGDPSEEMGATLPTPVGIEVVATTPTIAPLALPRLQRRGRCS